MHMAPEHQQQDLLWLIAGTGEGPLLARELLSRGWRLRVFVVSPMAARAYAGSPSLEISVGELGDADAIGRALDQAALDGRRPRGVVDGTHPFAARISAALASACGLRSLPLLRLVRPLLDPGEATLLPDLGSLRHVSLQGTALLLAIGARELARAIHYSPGARHHARILPNPAALAAAMAAGLSGERVAVLRPGAQACIERALGRRWCLEAVLCRRSGSTAELHWQRLARQEGWRLLLLERPPEPPGIPGLEWQALLERLGWP